VPANADLVRISQFRRPITAYWPGRRRCAIDIKQLQLGKLFIYGADVGVEARMVRTLKERAHESVEIFKTFDVV
jgi:hypothetical protein